MNETGIKEQVIKEIILLAQKYAIEKVILFGSRARGDYHRSSDIDLAVIPCVTCDVDNNRLGYGKGYYDRFLANTNMKKVCLCMKKVLQEKIPVDKYDVKMDIVVTE